MVRLAVVAVLAFAVTLASAAAGDEVWEVFEPIDVAGGWDSTLTVAVNKFAPKISGSTWEPPSSPYSDTVIDDDRVLRLQDITLSKSVDDIALTWSFQRVTHDQYNTAGTAPAELPHRRRQLSMSRLDVLNVNGQTGEIAQAADSHRILDGYNDSGQPSGITSSSYFVGAYWSESGLPNVAQLMVSSTLNSGLLAFYVGGEGTSFPSQLGVTGSADLESVDDSACFIDFPAFVGADTDADFSATSFEEELRASINDVGSLIIVDAAGKIVDDVKSGAAATATAGSIYDESEIKTTLHHASIPSRFSGNNNELIYHVFRTSSDSSVVPVDLEAAARSVYITKSRPSNILTRVGDVTHVFSATGGPTGLYEFPDGDNLSNGGVVENPKTGDLYVWIGGRDPSASPESWNYVIAALDKDFNAKGCHQSQFVTAITGCTNGGSQSRFVTDGRFYFDTFYDALTLVMGSSNAAHRMRVYQFSHDLQQYGAFNVGEREVSARPSRIADLAYSPQTQVAVVAIYGDNGLPFGAADNSVTASEPGIYIIGGHRCVGFTDECDCRAAEACGWCDDYCAPTDGSNPQGVSCTDFKVNRCLSLLELILIIAGALAALLIVGAGGTFLYKAVLVKPRQTKLEALMSAEAPDFMPMAYGPYYKGGFHASSFSSLSEVEAMLIEPRVQLALAIASATPVTEMDKLTRGLVLVFEQHGHTISLIRTFIKVEVAQAESGSTLFRSNSAANKLMKNFAMLVGLPYLFQTLAPIVREMAASQESHELDHTKVSDASELNVNKWGLLSYAQKTLNAITSSVDACPIQFRLICSALNVEVTKVYPQNTQQAMGNFMFLRFFVPAVTSPDVYGLLPEPPSDDTRRMLVLVGKTLQNLSNNVRFGAKEPYMAKMNDFIDANQNTLAKYFKRMCSVKSGTKAPKLTLVRGTYEKGLLYAYHCGYQNSHKVVNQLSELRATKIRDAWEKAVQEIGEIRAPKL